MHAKAAEREKRTKQTNQASKVKSSDQTSSPRVPQLPLLLPRRHFGKRFSEPSNSSRKYKINTRSLIIT